MRNARDARYARHVRIVSALAAAVLVLSVVGGCAAPARKVSTAPKPGALDVTAKSTYPLQVSDDMQRPVTIGSQPKRLVSLAPADTEILYALGKIDQVVGVSTFDDYPAKVKDIAKVGDFITPNMEALTASKPDVVFVTGGVQAETVEKLTAIGAQVVVVDPSSVEELYQSITMVGQVVGVPGKAASVVAGMKRDLAAITEKIGSDEPVTCFVEIGWNPLYTAGGNTLINDLVTKAGGVNVAKGAGYLNYSVERLLEDQPRVYLGTTSSLKDSGTIDQRPGYNRLQAVISGRVVRLDDNLVSRPGPRVVQGVREIAVALHPDRF